MKNSIDFDHSLLVKLIALKAVTWLSSSVVLWAIHHYFDLQLPFGSLVWSLALSAILIVIWLVRLRWALPVTEWEVFLLLLSDLLLLSALIELSGGSANPFTSSMLVPLALSAALLKKIYSLPMMLVAIAVYARWTFVGDAHHVDHANFSLHLYGMWINFVISAIILFVFITYATDSVRNRELQLQKAREKILRDEQLVAVATHTATTAHALGSPLSSMAILLEEWERDGKVNEDIDLFKQELKRCRNYLAEIGAATKKQSLNQQKVLPVENVYQNLQAHYQLLRPEAVIEFSFDAALSSRTIQQSGSLLLALVNLIDNAIQAESGKIAIQFLQKNNRLNISISDNGKGLSEELRSKLGKSFIDSSKGGWGMGVYLSHSTIEQFGGTISIVDAEQGGTITQVVLPFSQS
ncbi:MAG: ATP-binding protein [Agarilytica sp.]